MAQNAPKVLEKFRTDIEKSGFSIISVPEMGLHYTVGLFETESHPELAISLRVNPATAYGII